MTTPSSNPDTEVRMDIDLFGFSRVTGRLSLDRRALTRPMARTALHGLVEDILDQLFPPDPENYGTIREMVDALRRARYNGCIRQKAPPERPHTRKHT